MPREEGKTYAPIRGRIRVVGGQPFSVLENQLRHDVTLLSCRDIRPYLSSTIELVTVHATELHPTALYVVESALDNLRETHRQLAELGIDAFHLGSDPCALWLRVEGYDEELTFLPPLVERSEDDGGKLCIIDGLHRIFCSREVGEGTVTVILITGTAVPIVSYPVEWDDVKIVKTVPPHDQKRRFRQNSADEFFAWVANNPQRFVRGVDLPADTSPDEWVARFVWEKYGRHRPFPENLGWVMRRPADQEQTESQERGD